MCKELEQIQRTYSSYGRNLILLEYIKLLLLLLHNFAQNVPRPLSGRVPGLSFSTLLILEPVAFTL